MPDKSARGTLNKIAIVAAQLQFHAADGTCHFPICRNGYAPIVELCQRYSADFNFTCVEMKDCEQPEFARCGPEELLKQVNVRTITVVRFGRTL